MTESLLNVIFLKQKRLLYDIMAQVFQIDYVTIPQRQALRVHCPVESCKHIWIYQGYKVKGWIACPVCKRQLKLGDYPKDKEVPT